MDMQKDADKSKKTGRKQKSDNRASFRALAMISQFGISMLVPIFLMSFLGIFLDRVLGTSFCMVVFFFIGALAGGRNVYRMAKQIYHGQDGGGGHEREQNHHQ